jgi:hypothetical protein
VRKALLVNLNEEVTGDLDVAGDPRGASLRLDVPAGGIVTVCIRL